jgi:hypothetical protein
VNYRTGLARGMDWRNYQSRVFGHDQNFMRNLFADSVIEKYSGGQRWPFLRANTAHWHGVLWSAPAERSVDGAVGQNARLSQLERFVPKRCRSRYRGIATALHSAPSGERYWELAINGSTLRSMATEDGRMAIRRGAPGRKWRVGAMNSNPAIKIKIMIKIKKSDVSDRRRGGEMPELTEARGRLRM